MELRNLLQTIVDLKASEILNLAKGSLERLMPVCRQLDPEHDGCDLLHSILLTALFADEKVTERERELIRALLGFRELDEFLQLWEKETMPARVQAMVKEHSDLVREDTVMLVIAVTACDGTITKTERELIESLL